MNRLKGVFIILLFCLCVPELHAQFRIIAGSQEKKGNEPKEEIRESGNVNSGNNPRQKKAQVPDTVYAREVIKHNGWLEPRIQIPREQIDRYEFVVMFTGLNSKGHWTKMEYVDYTGKNVPGKLTPYIANYNSDSDNAINKEWINALKKCSIYEMIPDASGENVNQERVFDTDYNLVYVFSVFPVGNNRFVGSYRDIFGFPGEMRDAPEYSYGTLVLIDRDEKGYDARIQFTDSKLNPKPNGNDVFAEEWYYTESGAPYMVVSVDENGKPTIDNYSNSGQLLEYDPVTGLLQKLIFLNENLEPMTVFPETKNSSYGIGGSLFIYDNYGRQETISFIDKDNLPSENYYGCHKVKYVYDDHGRTLSQTAFDLNGDPAVMDKDGYHRVELKYDSLGRNTDIAFYGVDGNFIETGDICHVIYDYSEEGELIFSSYRMCEKGEEKILRQEKNTITPEGRTYEYISKEEDIILLEKYDTKEREISMELTDLYYNTKASDDGWSRKEVTYIDSPGKTGIVTKLFDEKGNLFIKDNGDIKVENLDSIARTRLLRIYRDGELIETNLQHYDKGFAYILSQSDMNAFGVKTRAGGSSSVLCYDARVLSSPQKEFQAFIGYDEFDEPDYIIPKNGVPYFYLRITKQGGQFMSDNDSPTSSQLKARVPKIMTIEIIDSIGYKNGLKDNDVILAYGDYVADLSFSENFNDFTGRWTVRKVLEAKNPREMIVFRVEDGKENKYGIVRLQLPAGSDTELGFATHVRYLTDRQKNRILDCIDQTKEYYSLVERSNKLKEEQNLNIVLIYYPTLFRHNRNQFYNSNFKEAGIFVGYFDEAQDEIWTLNKLASYDLPESIPYSDLLAGVKAPERHYFVSLDGVSSKAALLHGVYSGPDWQLYKVNDEDYHRINLLCESVTTDIENLRKVPLKIMLKDLAGHWEVEETEGDIQFGGIKGYLDLTKDGRCSGNLGGVTVIPPTAFSDLDSNLLFYQNKDWTGRLDIQPAGYLLFTPDYGWEDDFECFAVVGPDKNEFSVEKINQLYSYSNDFWKSKMESISYLPDYLKIVDINKNKMTLTFDGKSTFTLVKKKKK